jgi:hypothetical protein
LHDTRFDRPVSIFVGLGFPHDVETVGQAHQLLCEWSIASRGPHHMPALETCKAALAGRAPASSAREALETFARGRGVLASDALRASVSDLVDEWLTGNVCSIAS